MRRLALVVSLVAVIAIVGIVSSTIMNKAAAMSNGAPRLECIQCHQDAKNRPAAFTVEGLPATVEPGKEYTIKVKITKGPKSLGAAYGGFAVKASAGKLIVADKDNTMMSGDLLTHTKKGSMHREWTFKWKAPSKCTGDVKFRISVIAANGDGSNIGDAFASKELTVKCGKPKAAAPAKTGTATATAKPKPKVITTTKTYTETELVTTTVTTTKTLTSTTAKPGLAAGVAVIVFLIVVAGYLALARK